jgi:hypothetical protein
MADDMTSIQFTPAHSTAVFAMLMSEGSVPTKTPPLRLKTPSLSGSLAVTARVAGSANIIGPHNERPHSLPPSRAQRARASSK